MKRRPLKSTELYEVRRFNQRTKEAREKAWLEARNDGLGGSDMGTIMGLNKYATPLVLWLEKTGREEHEDIGDKWAIVKGNALEVELRRRFRALHPEWSVTSGTNISLISNKYPYLRASLDGIIYDPESDSFGVLEIKTANANRGRNDWHDDDGTLIIPDYYMAQVTHYLAVTGWTWGYVYADIGEREPVEIRFERDEDDVNAVIKAAEEFWGFVQRDEMPQLMAPDIDTLYPEDDGELEIPEDTMAFDQLAKKYAMYSEIESAAKNDKNEISDKLKVMVAEHKGLQTGLYKVTYGTVHHKAKPAQPAKPAYETRQIRVTEIKEK
jgi:putative phage-type endonuclease